MALGFKVCLASELKMQVTLNGSVIEGAKVVRQYEELYGKETSGQQEALTDKNGNVTLPAIYGRTFLKHLPIENRIKQQVYIYYRDKQYLGIDITKRNYDLDGELNNATYVKKGIDRLIPFHFKCELTDPSQGQMVKDGWSKYVGICKPIND